MPAWNGAWFSLSQHQSTLALQKFNQFFSSLNVKSVSGVRSFNVTRFLSSFCDRKWSYADGDRVIVQPFREHKRKVRGVSSVADWLKRGRGVWGRVEWNWSENGEHEPRPTQEREVILHRGARAWTQGEWHLMPVIGAWLQEENQSHPGPS